MGKCQSCILRRLNEVGGFKDMVQGDIKDVFLDFDMFGEKHTVAGKDLIIILDDVEKLRRNELYQDNKAIYSKRIFFYVAAEDIGKLPEPGRVVCVDGRDYKILQAENESGIYAIMAEEFRD